MQNSPISEERRKNTAKCMFWVKTISFVVIISLCFAAFWGVFRFKYADGIYGWDKYQEQPKGTVDVLVLGSSHAFEGINPAVLYGEYGIAAFDLCGSIQLMWNTYFFLQEALKTQSPKLVILEAYGVTKTNEFSDASRIIKNNYGISSLDQYLPSLMASVPSGELEEYLWQFNQFHSRYTELSPADFKKNLGEEQFVNWKGFGNNTGHTVFERPEFQNLNERLSLTGKTEIYYRKVIELCKEKGIPLLVVAAPYILTAEEQMRFNRAEAIAQEYDVPFINYNKIYDNLALDFATDFADPEHLNESGNIKFTEKLGEYLIANYDLNDRREQPLWKSWEKNAQHFVQSKKNRELAGITDLKSYISKISQSKEYVVAISVLGDCADVTGVVMKLFNRYSITNYPYDLNIAWIVANGEVSNSFRRGDTAPYYKIGSMTFDFPYPDIRVNHTSMKKVINGINIVVYDTVTDTIADVVGFDASNIYDAVR